MSGAQRVLLTVDGFFPESFGGGESYVAGVARELSRRGREVTVLTRGGRQGGGDAAPVRRDRRDGYTVVRLAVDPARASFGERATGEGAQLGAAVSRAIDEAAPDVVHVNGVKARAVAACVRRGVPHVVTAHHVGLVCPAGALLLPGGGACPGPRSLRACVRCANRWRRPAWYTGGLLGLLPAPVYRPLGRHIARGAEPGFLARGLVTPWLIEEAVRARRGMLAGAQRVIAPSRYLHDLLVANGCPAEKVELLPHGVDGPAASAPPPPAPAPRVGAGRAPVRFGYLGRIAPDKGLDLLLEAAAATGRGVCEVHVFGAARNPRDETFRRVTLARAAGRVGVVDHGLLPPERMAEAYRAVDVVVVPSRVPEAFGLVVAESFAAGRPVVVTDVGALAEQVRDGVDGLVVERPAVDALVAALRRFVADPGLAAALAAGVRPGLTVAGHVDRLERVYEGLTRG